MSFSTNLSFNEITSDFGVSASRESKVNAALELVINDLPFGKTISEKYKIALKKVIETIMFYNNVSKIAVIPLETGLGKTLTMTSICAFMVNDEILRPYSGTIILHLLQKDCDRTAYDINQKAGKEVAYSYHSGKEKGKKRNNIDVSELEKYPIIVTTHEGYKRFVEPDSKNPINKILSWTDKQINANKTNWNRYYRRRLIVDEEISNVKIYNITIDSLNYLRDIGLNLGNSLLMDKLNEFIYNIERLFLRSYDASSEKLKFISIDLEVPKDIEKAIYAYGDYKAKDIFLGIVNFVEHGGLIKNSQKKESKYISTYQYIDINHPLFYTIQLDATAKINYLYKLNDDFEIIDLPKLKTYKNTYIHIYKKTTGSKTNLKQQFENGLLTASVDSIISKIEDNSKVLIIFNDSNLEKLFRQELLKHGDFPNISFTHFGEITGENTWRDYEKAFILGTPIYRESNYPIFYHCTSKDFDLNKFDMLMLPDKGAKRYKEIEFEKVRVSLIARDLVQGINRVRCRLWENGDTPETHVYLINKDEEVNKLIKEAMPMVNIAYDWDIAHNNITQEEYEKSLPAEERLLIYLKKILHDADYREELIQKGVITKKGISKQGLRMTVTSMESRATFNKAIRHPIVEEFCINNGFDISNKKAKYIAIKGF